MDNKNNTVKTKIIATLGPSSNSPDKIKNLILMGMNVARINMSHFSNINDFEGMIKSVRQESFKCNQHVGILVDLAGPKIRLDLNKDCIEIEKNKVYSLGYDIENDFKINSDLKFDEIFKKKSFIKIDDGKVLLHCWCGCTAQEIVKAIDLDLHYLFPANSIKTGQPPVRQWARKRLESVRKFEYLVVEIITVDFKKNRLNLHDLDRLFLACERIRKVEGVLYG